MMQAFKPGDSLYVALYDPITGDEEYFIAPCCDNWQHAVEQAQNAYPEFIVIRIEL